MSESAASEARASVPTKTGAKYVQQLCKHWAHKLPVTFEEDTGVVTFDSAVATMKAEAQSIEVSIRGEDREAIERLKDVVARHLDRFAFREAPLAFDWTWA
jgi:uncharacterized protein